MPDFLNPIAEMGKPDSGNIITPAQAYIIRKNNSFFCPDHDCKDPKRKLIPKISKNGNYFFSHIPNCGHNIFPETLFHKLAIKWFQDQVFYELPQHKSLGNKFVKELIREKTIPEFRLLKRIIPDVRLFSKDNFEFAIEIVVTSDITINKEKLIKEFKLPTIRVDLNDFYEENKDECRTNLEFIQNSLPALLSDINRKSWAVPPLFNVIDKADLSTNPNKGCLLILAGAVFIFIIIGIISCA